MSNRLPRGVQQLPSFKPSHPVLPPQPHSHTSIWHQRNEHVGQKREQTPWHSVSGCTCITSLPGPTARDFSYHRVLAINTYTPVQKSPYRDTPPSTLAALSPL
eukprot:1193528-Prorocentrum_minimum.AAC.3